MSESKLLARLLEAEERIAALETVIATLIFHEGCVAADKGIDSFTSSAAVSIEVDLHRGITKDPKGRAVLERAVRLMLDSLPDEHTTSRLGPTRPSDD